MTRAEKIAKLNSKLGVLATLDADVVTKQAALTELSNGDGTDSQFTAASADLGTASGKAKAMHAWYEESAARICTSTALSISPDELG